jgi:hypothetical protein
MVRGMKIPIPLAVLSVLALALGACSGGEKTEASKDVARFLDAVRRGDRQAFDAGVNRPEVRSDLREQVKELARLKGVEVDGGPSEFAMDRMIAPEAFHMVDARTGQPPAAGPTPAQVEAMLKVRNATRVCLDDATTHACRITFAKRDGGWKLVGMPATDLRIEVPPPAPAKP